MTAERQRLEAAASNLANSNTTRTAEGGPYRRRDVLLETVSASEAAPSSILDSSFGDLLQSAGRASGESVRAKTVVAQSGAGVQRYDPGHPDADADGYVTAPDVDPLEETVNMMSAARAFEANATAFNTAKEMARASLKLGES